MMHAKEKVFQEGQDYFDHLISDIDQAKSLIDIEIYAFRLDPLGKRLVTHLIQAAKRGVCIRILVDGMGTTWWHGSLIRSLEQAGAVTKVHNPLPWQPLQWHRSVSHLPIPFKIGYFFLKVNARTHRKFFIIDQKITYIGSYNVDHRHIGDQHCTPWRDTGVRLENADIGLLIESFESNFYPTRLKERWTRQHPVDLKSTILLNHGRHRRRVLYKNLLRKIGKCQRRIWITNAYFIPDTFLLRQLKFAASKGVDVRILLPRYSDVPMMPWASQAFYLDLMKDGVRIFEYLPSMLHAKTIVLDDLAYVGTSNLNHRSLLHDLEIDVRLEDPHNTEHIATHFEKDLKDSDEIQPKLTYRPFYQRCFGRILLFTRYFL